MYNLEKLIKLRAEIVKLNYEVQEIMPLAIAEALELYITSTDTSNQIVFVSKLGKIGVVFKKRTATIKDDITLARIDEDIMRIQGSLASKNKEKLSIINEQIDNLQTQIEKFNNEQDSLLTNHNLIKLKQQFIIRRDDSIYYEPNISVYLL